jgi:hypothetical protein
VGRCAGGQHPAAGGVLGKRLRTNERLWEELAYVVPLGIPHSRFLDWSDDDQDKAIAFLRDQRNRCPNCGTREEDWAEDKFAFVGWHDRCLGCEAVEQERKNIPEGALGMRVKLLPREVVEKYMEDEG